MTIRILRGSLAVSVALNLFGVVVFGSAALGRPAVALPLPIAPFYAAQLALVIGLFGAVYAWLLSQAAIDRPLLLVGGLGKIGFFSLFLAYWSAGDLPAASVAQAAPDLVLGSIFIWWLRVTGHPVTPARQRSGSPAGSAKTR